MNPELEKRMQNMRRRCAELTQLLAAPETLSDRRRVQKLSQEFRRLEPAVKCYEQYRRCIREEETARELCDDGNSELRAMASEERQSAARRAAQCLEELQELILQSDEEKQSRNAFLEIRAGTGGQEAALFAADLFRMYSRYAEKNGWSVEILSGAESEYGGWKEVISFITGEHAYSRLQFESGAHRVQRVPETESQGRIHTSACTVAVLPEMDATDAVSFGKQDLRIDTFRASGAGGQHVNKTDSAVRITHLPSGVVVECKQERSQLQNRAQALRLLQAKLQEAACNRRQQQRTEQRRSLVGSGDRSERIRTYNFPQGRVTDHRIRQSWRRLSEILDGDLNELIQALHKRRLAEKLISL